MAAPSPGRAAAGRRRAGCAASRGARALQHRQLDSRRSARAGPLAARARLTMARKPRLHYHVYVVELDDRVWNNARFRRCNPDYRLGMPLVYVGMTGLDPDLRFDRHKAGIQANAYVQEYGVKLRPDLYAVYNPMPYRAAV